MAKSLLKGLALTLGGGVALGVGIKIGQGALGHTAELEGQPADLEPVLGRLENIESRIVQVETTLSEGPIIEGGVPSEWAEPIEKSLGVLEGRLTVQTSQMDTLRRDLEAVDRRSTDRLNAFGRTMDELQTKLPGLIEETVGTCFHQMEAKLHKDIEETHNRTLETFVDNIQNRVVQRISAFETDLAGQAAAMTQLREYSLKTDQNMQRLLLGVDRLASEIGRRSPASTVTWESPIATKPEPAETPVERKLPDFKPPEPKTQEAAALPPLSQPAEPPAAEPGQASTGFVPKSFTDTPEDRKPRSKWKFPIISAIVAVPVAIAGWQFSDSMLHERAVASSVKAASPQAPVEAATPAIAVPGEGMTAAAGYLARKQYDKAEEIYRSILKRDPKNKEAILALADVLYRQQRYEDSAKVLEALKANNE